MTASIEIPLNKLVPFAGNVRKTYSKAFIGELAASIKAHGLQQNLVVKKDGRNYAVVAGGQRLKALLTLAKAGAIKPTHPVPCNVAGDDTDPAELSLAENVMREDMHPADQFEAFRDLVDKGIPVTDIAARFGKTEIHVTKLLKLARVSPAVLKAYRDGKLTLEQVMAFAVTDDHGAQEYALENLRPHQRDPRSIRDTLTENEIPATDRRVKFVTLKAYEKAGGRVRRDLFSEGAGSIFILDAGLLNAMATGKLERAARNIAKEGWKWVEFQIDFGHEQRGQFRRVAPMPAPLPPALDAEWNKLDAEYETLEKEWKDAGEEAEFPARLQEIGQRLSEIADRPELVYTPEQLAMAGAVVTIGNDGKAEIIRGLVRPDDLPKKVTAKAEPEAAGEDETHAPALSAALVESLTAHRSAALAAELVNRPDIALAAVVHGFVSGVFVSSAPSSLHILAIPQSLRRVEGSKAFEQLEAAREKWHRTLPGTNDLWTWCLAQDKAVLLELLAFCAAATVDAVQGKGDRTGAGRLQHADKLSLALGLDMKTWFTPDAANYFSRVSKPQIFDALKEGRSQPPAPAWEKLKKPELAQLAERELSGKGWLPEVLRPAA